jgi:hypothetical protein
MNKALVASSVLSLIQPSVYAVAGRLFVLSTGRAGSSRFKPTVATFYETGLVTSIYEHLLMDPRLSHLEIRHEMPYKGPVGAPKRVDLWIRPPKGGYAHLLEAGDFVVRKVHSDLAKIRAINPSGANWFLAFFRGPNGNANPWPKINASFGRTNGLDRTRCQTEQKFCGHFNVYRPDGSCDGLGYALFRAV